MKKFQSFKVQMPGCEMSENFENILSPNQMMAEPGKISKFQIQKPLNEKVKK